MAAVFADDGHQASGLQLQRCRVHLRRTLCIQSGGTRCLKPPRGARLQEVVNLRSARRCSFCISDTTCADVHKAYTEHVTEQHRMSVEKHHTTASHRAAKVRWESGTEIDGTSEQYKVRSPRAS